jgi:hypothetical protein
MFNLREAKEICSSLDGGDWEYNYNDGDWGASVEDEHGTCICTTEQSGFNASFQTNAKFIAYSRNALPEAIELIEELRKEIKTLKKKNKTLYILCGKLKKKERKNDTNS